jgi:hypothetical protein
VISIILTTQQFNVGLFYANQSVEYNFVQQKFVYTNGGAEAMPFYAAAHYRTGSFGTSFYIFRVIPSSFSIFFFPRF